MSELMKSKDESNRCNSTARTSRYNEDDGLLNNIRSEDYAHRVNDEDAAKGLEKILILMHCLRF